MKVTKYSRQLRPLLELPFLSLYSFSHQSQIANHGSSSLISFTHLVLLVNVVGREISAGNNSKQTSSVINLSIGGGAVKSVGESFNPNPFSGHANISVPIATSLGR